MFGNSSLGQRKRLGCWFYVALLAIALNPLVWQAVLKLLDLAVKFLAVHVAAFP